MTGDGHATSGYTNFVYTGFVKNVTLTADEELINRARHVARSQHKTLNVAFREWLREYVDRESDTGDYDALMARLSYAQSTGPYTRDEMNER
ncbi:MAG TPA: hypothetical protein VGM11_13630 [Acidobacteriaceae bacterium]